MPTPTWTDATARLHAKGAITYSKSSALSLEDVYQVTMPNGTRPLGYDVNYRTGSGSRTIAKNVTGIPKRGAPHPDYSCFRATDISWSQPDPRSRVWECRVGYVYNPSAASSATQDDDIVSITFGSVSIHAPITTGDEGAAMHNSAGDPFDPVPMCEISCPTVDIVRNESTEPADRQQYQGAINSQGVIIAGLSFPQYTARVTWTARRIEDEEEEEGGASHLGDRFQYTYHVEGNFSIKPREDGDTPQGGEYTPKYGGWVQYIPDMGWNHIEKGVKVANTVTADGATMPNPQQQFLAEDGSIKATGYPRYIPAFPYPVQNFGSLDLPSEA